MSHETTPQPRPRASINARRPSIWWTTTYRFCALYLAFSGLRITESKPLLWRRNSSNATVSEAVGCVVLGLQIQGTAGLELQEALSRSEEPLPVIFVTAHRDISSSVHPMKQGAVDVLTNPVWVMSCSKRCSGHSPGAPPSGKRS